MRHPQFVLLLPVKAPALGKSRLRVPDHLRPGLATAFALDALTAARATPSVAEVVVVTSDPGFAQRCAALGVVSVPDGDGLNDSLVMAARAVGVRWPNLVPVALCADLPCLQPDDLARALTQVTGEGSWFVSDAEGVGTTMYAATYDRFAPRFGTGSRAAHDAAGATEIEGELCSLRHDVDDEAALAAALLLGAGSFTLAAVALLPSQQ